MAKRLHIAAQTALPIDFVTETIALLAIKGAGKTYAFLKLAEELIKAGQPVAILDHVGVCWGLRSSASGKRAGLPVFVLGGEHGDAPLEAHGGKIVARWFSKSRVSVVLDMSAFPSKADERRFVADFCDALYRINRKPVHVMIDEADEYAPQKPKGETARSTGMLEVIVRRGRARGIGITMATQRPAVLNKDVLTQAGTLLFGRVVSPHDRKAVGTWLQGQAAPADVGAIVDALPSMPKGEFHLWSPAYGLFERIKIGARITYDSSATPKPGQRRRAPKATAKVNLRALTAEMTAAREQQEANDPKRLQKRIAELEAAVKKANDHTVHMLHTAPAPKPGKPIKVPVMTKAERAMLVKIAALSAQQTAMLAKLATASATLGPSIEKLTTKIFARLNGHTDKSTTRSGATVDHVRAQQTTRTGRRDVPMRPASAGTRQRQHVATHEGRAHTTRPAGDAESSAGTLGGQQLEVLRAACQFGRVTQKQLGVLLGVKAKGSTLRAYTQRLVRDGYLHKDGDGYGPTGKGIDAAGDFTPLPSGRRELIAHWQTKLSGQQREIFDLIVGGDDDIDAIAETLGVKAKGSTVRAYLQRMARLGIITKAGNTVRLSEQFGD